MKKDYRAKIQFWLRFTGWLCLIPASTYLYLYQEYSSSKIGGILLGMLILIIAFAIYLLATAKSERWTKPKNVMGLAIFALVFVWIFSAIPLFIAYRNCKSLNQ